MKGSYSYKNTKSPKYLYKPSNDGTREYYLQIQPVTGDVARLQFLSNNKDGGKKVIPIPKGFRVLCTDSNEFVPICQKSFFITWVNSYKVKHGDVTILKIVNQKQQSIISSASITLLEETDENNDVKKTKKQLSKGPRNKERRTKVAKGECVVDFL
ncbi:MAG: hypothetical protein ACXV2C_00070 [Candidatus Bathyarchaeia archaeon]